MARKPAKPRKTTRRASTGSEATDPVTFYARQVVAAKITAGPHVRDACRRHLDDLKRKDLWFDKAAALRAIGFFPDILRLSEGQFEGRPFSLHLSQKFIVGALFGWKTHKAEDAPRRFTRAYIEQGKGNGKALAVDTPIPTPTGWKLMGELQAGDQVFDENGQVCSVLVAHAVTDDVDCYELEFDDGSKVIASSEHLWLTERRRSPSVGAAHRATCGVPKKDWGKWRRGIHTTEEIANTLTYKNGNYQSANHSIGLAGPLQAADADLLVPPYTLGAWLGDGDSDCARITCAFADSQIIDTIKAEGIPVTQQVRHSATTGRYSLSSGRGGLRSETLNYKLRSLGLLGNKHIPEQYLRSSISQRMRLLQGLMDTDGNITSNAQCEFSNCNKVLAENVYQLALTLGLKATFSRGRAKINGRDCGEKYRVSFYPGSDMPVFQLQRKRQRQTVGHDRRRLSADRRIVQCKKIDPVPVRCITVDSPSSMFLCSEAMIPTHNSPMIGGIGLYGMLADNESGAQIYAAAARKDQAGILFQDAVKMVRQSEVLSDRITFSGQNPVWRMSHLPSGSFFTPISREAGKTGSGPRPHMALCDEVHEHPDRGIMEMLERGFKFRRQPLLLMITNSGSDRNSVCWEEHEHAIAVAAGEKQDDTTFSYVCALDEGDDPLHQPECWVKANPLLGVTITQDYLAKVVAQGKAIPGKLNNILRLHFCVWTDSEAAWITRDAWEACEDPDMRLEDFEGQACWAGLDLSATKDLTGKALVFADGTTEEGLPKFALFAHGYTPKETLHQRTEADRAPYDVWAEQGFLTPLPGKVIRYDHIAADLVEDGIRFDLMGVAYDRWLIKHFEEALDETGATMTLMEHPQGITQRKDSPLWMPGSIDMFERLILEKRIRIQVNPALRSSVAGACFWTSPAGLRRFEKQKATQRIDLAVAAAMAIGAATAEDTNKPSVYETRGPLLI